MEPPPDALQTFRRSFYECLYRRADALFELTDAILAADGAVPSPAHLSLQPPHRRGWGSLYAALCKGRIDAESLRGLLVRHPLAGSRRTPVYAVDVSVWDRCDAECSPERGYYYHPSRHSAGQPIVAGWAYQFVAQLNFVRESWTAPMDVERLRPGQDANVVAAEQVRSFLRRRRRYEGRTGASPPVRLRRGLRSREAPAGAGGMSLPDPRPFASGAALLRRPEPVRPAGTRRTPSSPRAEDEVLGPEHLARTLRRASLRGRRLRIRARAGVGRDASEGRQPRRKGYSGTPAHRGRHTHPGGGRAPAPRREAARASRPCGCGGTARRG